jgi:hypothetical protein
MEPAKRHNADLLFPVPAVQTGQGIAWAVAPDHVISRRELSDTFLGLFETLDHARLGVRRGEGA